MKRLNNNCNTMKRGRPSSTGPVLDDASQKVLGLIRSKEANGISRPQIKYGTNLPDSVITKSINSLKAQNLIKKVVNIKNKRSKHYIGVEFELSEELSGGQWYVDGQLDVEFIKTLRQVCLKLIERKVPTLEGISDAVNGMGVVQGGVSSDQICQILTALVLDGEVEEVASNGTGDFCSVAVGKVCYRTSVTILSKTSGLSSIPCGVCPHISVCTPDGVISPNTCVYFTKWLDF